MVYDNIYDTEHYEGHIPSIRIEYYSESNLDRYPDGMIFFHVCDDRQGTNTFIPRDWEEAPCPP